MWFRGLSVIAIFLSLTARGWDEPKCKEVLFSGHEYKFNAKSIDEMIAIIESTNLDHLNGKLIRTPWEMGMLPNLAARKLGYQYQLEMLTSWISEKTIQRLYGHQRALETTRRILEGDSTLLSKLSLTDDALFLLVNQANSDRPEFQEADKFTLIPYCAYYQPMSVQRCYQAMDQIMNLMAPVQNITARNEIHEVLTDSTYVEPLSRLALDYMAHIETNSSLGKRRLNEDLSRVLESKEKAWKVLAVLAARGANFYKLFHVSSQKTFRTVSALAVIASASLVFDQSNSHWFSLPAGVNASCDSGKTYHFWMAAYLSQKFNSKWAAYLSSLAYQMKSKTEFRDPNRAFVVSVKSNANDKIRIDLAYAAAGAEFGSLKTGSFPKIDIDRKLKLLDDHAEMIDPMSAEDAKGFWENSPLWAFYRWNRIFHPERAME